MPAPFVVKRAPCWGAGQLSGELAKDLIGDCLTRQQVTRDTLSLHADRGTSMTSNTAGSVSQDGRPTVWDPARRQSVAVIRALGGPAWADPARPAAALSGFAEGKVVPLRLAK